MSEASVKALQDSIAELKAREASTDQQLADLETAVESLHKLAEDAVVSRERLMRVQSSTVNAVASMWQRLGRLESIIYDGVDPARVPTERPPALGGS